MKVTELWIYPIKSCAGIRLQKMNMTSLGPEFDRAWMIVDADGKFVTQRQFPQMAQIETKIEDTKLKLKIPDGEWMTPDDSDSGAEIPVQVWKSNVLAKPVGKNAIDVALTDFLQHKVSLVAHTENTNREGGVRFSDSNAVLVVNETSLTELNSRLENKILMNDFRANIIVADEPAWSEDQWIELKFGDVELKFIKLCGRCSMIGSEPLKELAKFRRIEKSVNFGSLYRVMRAGRLAIT
jgi:uncharacterized protein